MNTQLTRLGMAIIRAGLKQCGQNEWGDFEVAYLFPKNITTLEFEWFSDRLDHRYQEPPCA